MSDFSKKIWFTGAVFCATAIAFGAFGAHALKNILEATGRTAVFETASKYHFFHGLGLFVIYFLYDKFPSALLKNAFFVMLAGTIIFSGSLYLLCILDIPKFGMITPAGGVLLIASWLMIAFAAFRQNK